MRPRQFAIGVLLAAFPVTSLPPASTVDKMRGVSLEGAGPVEAGSLAPLRELGADWISQTPFGWVPSLDAPEIRWRPDGGLWGETDEGLVETADLARALGIKTLLKPHLWVRHGAWPGDIAMPTGDAWSRWFSSYGEFILHYAKLAEERRFEALAIGSELAKTTSRTEDWRRLIARVREVYHGKLTYCANWNGEAEQVGFWGDLDFVGIQAYYPLAAAARPSKLQIEAGWKPVVARLETLSRRTGKPIVFTEVGYKSHEGSLREPWRWEASGAPDTAIQRDAYAAMFESLWGRPWFGGTFVWKWHTSESVLTRHERDFTPQGKPALSVIRAYYTAR